MTEDEMQEVAVAFADALADAGIKTSRPRVNSGAVMLVAIIDGTAFKVYAQEVIK